AMPRSAKQAIAASSTRARRSASSAGGRPGRRGLRWPAVLTMACFIIERSINYKGSRRMSRASRRAEFDMAPAYARAESHPRLRSGRFSPSRDSRRSACDAIGAPCRRARGHGMLRGRRSAHQVGNIEAGITVTATGIWPPLAAPLLNGIALMLALGFHRNRAVLVLTILTFSSFALAGVLVPEQSDRGADAARMFAPWLLLAAAALPERSLLARRNLVLLLLLAIAAWLTLAAPAHVWPGLRGALPLGALPWSAGTIAAALTFTAAALCILRWV